MYNPLGTETLFSVIGFIFDSDEPCVFVLLLLLLEAISCDLSLPPKNRLNIPPDDDGVVGLEDEDVDGISNVPID